MAEQLRCSGARPLLEAFVDGELSAEQMLLVEEHLGLCSRCTQCVEFSGAIKNSTARVVSRDSQVNPAFLLRLKGALDAESSRETAQRVAMHADGAGGRPLRHSVTASAFALAAGSLLWIGLTNRAQSNAVAVTASAPEPKLSGAVAAVGAMGVEQTLDRLIDYHSAPPRPQVTNVDLLPSFEPDVGVHIRLPKLTRYNAQWEGANLVPVKDRTAASLRYRVSGHRVTVYVYDASKVRIDERLERRVVKDNPIYVGQWRGYNVATTEHRGTGYAAAADLDASDLENIVAELR